MIAKFKDINFKLCVIQELMYNQHLLKPAFDIYEFVDTYKARAINIKEQGFDIIPEALAYFEKLEIPTELLECITEIYQDGGDEIYMNIAPYWDGEDNSFDIQSAEDTVLLPNLERVTIFGSCPKSILKAFQAKNIEAEYL